MAAPTAGPSGPPRSNEIIPANWPVQAADTIAETIGKVRDKTTKPAITASRGLVYGLLALIVGTIAAILLLILVVRIYANYSPFGIWLLYTVLAVVMIGFGTWLLKQATSPAPTS